MKSGLRSEPGPALKECYPGPKTSRRNPRSEVYGTMSRLRGEPGVPGYAGPYA